MCIRDRLWDIFDFCAILPHQVERLIELESTLLKIQILNLLDINLNRFEEIKENKEKYISSFKQSVTDFSRSSRTFVYALNFKLPNGRYLNEEMEAVYPMEELEANFDNMQVIFFDESKTKEEKRKEIETRIDRIRDRLKIEMLQRARK